MPGQPISAFFLRMLCELHSFELAAASAFPAYAFAELLAGLLIVDSELMVLELLDYGVTQFEPNEKYGCY